MQFNLFACLSPLLRPLAARTTRDYSDEQRRIEYMHALIRRELTARNTSHRIIRRNTQLSPLERSLLCHHRQRKKKRHSLSVDQRETVCCKSTHRNPAAKNGSSSVLSTPHSSRAVSNKRRVVCGNRRARFREWRSATGIGIRRAGVQNGCGLALRAGELV